MPQDIGPLVVKAAWFWGFFLAVPRGMQDLNSPTRDRTHAPCNGSAEP